MIETTKVMPWGEGQGEFVVINADDFDPKVHTRFGAGGGEAPSAARPDPAEAPAKPAAKRRKRKARK